MFRKEIQGLSLRIREKGVLSKELRREKPGYGDSGANECVSRRSNNQMCQELCMDKVKMRTKS